MKTMFAAVLALSAFAGSAHATNTQCPNLSGTFSCPNGNFTLNVKTLFAGNGTAVYTYQYSYMPMPYNVVASNEGVSDGQGAKMTCENKKFYYGYANGDRRAYNYIMADGNYIVEDRGGNLICTRIAE